MSTDAGIRNSAVSIRDGWNQFWFSPADPATLSLIRVLAGTMLFYTHLVWSLDLAAFFGPNAWISPERLNQIHDGTWYWTHLRMDSMTGLWIMHAAALCVFAALALGFFSRIVAVLAWLLTVSYMQRTPSALFGLDQVNTMLAMYLMLGPCGARYSLDAFLRNRDEEKPVEVEPDTWANFAVRLIQVHMCVIYFFAATRKLMGPSWWDGTAMWLAFGNYEYQSIDMTFLAGWPTLVALLTHVTLFWELSYAALIWPRATRTIMLALAVVLHLGIAIFLGMATFGLVMLIGNLAFVSPETVRSLFARFSRTKA